MKQKAIEVIYSAIDALNEQLPPDRRVDKNPDAILFGDGGKIDSVGFINLVVLVEEKCQEKLGVPVCLTGETVDMDDNSPFQNVGALADYICRLVEAQPRKN